MQSLSAIAFSVEIGKIVVQMIKLGKTLWNPQKNRLLADGAWGTELIRRGLPPGEAAEGFNLTHPDIVRQVAEDYLAAGSDIILTNSFVGSRLQLERHGLADRTEEINRVAAEISAAAARDFVGKQTSLESPIVAGSIGPSGKLVVMGEIQTEYLYEIFSEQAVALESGGADIILIETIVDLQEMLVAVGAAKDATTLPVVASMTYEKTHLGYRTIMGNSPEDCVSEILEAGAEIVGANCGTGIENYLELAKQLCEMNVAPIWIKANAGLPTLDGNTAIYHMTAAHFSQQVAQLLETGVAIVGGCCGTTPDFVKEMRKVIDGFNNTKH